MNGPVRRVSWIDGVQTWRAPSPCVTVAAEIARAVSIYGTPPDRVTASHRGVVLRWRYARTYIVAPFRGA